MHYLFYMIAHALVYIGVWHLVDEYHINPWLVLGVGAAATLLFRRGGSRRNYRGPYQRRRGHRQQDRGDGQNNPPPSQ